MTKVLLKLSGESFANPNTNFGIDPKVIERIASEITKANNENIQIGVVVGGGNFFRGVQESAKNMAQANADYMGMLATVMNALAMQSSLEQNGLQSRVQSALPISAVCEPYIRRRAVRHMEKKRIVIFAAGTGNPFFTTDTAAALRATEMGCDAILKATKVDGVYDADPEQNKNAKRYDALSYLEVLSRDLKVMDAPAISLAKENSIPILVFSIQKSGTLADVIRGDGLHTLIS